MSMSKMVQIRNMPDRLHRLLKARAALAGMSLSEYLLRELEKSAEYPSMEEFRERLARREPVDLPEPAAEVIRRERTVR